MSSPVSKKRKWVWVSIGQALSQLVLPLKHQEVLLPPLFPSFIPPALGEIASSQSTCTSPPREKTLLWPFPGGSDSKDPPAMRETWVQSLGWDDPLEKGVATHSSILAWRIPSSEEPGYSPWGSKESDMIEMHRTSLSKAWQWLLKLELLGAKGNSRKFTK